MDEKRWDVLVRALALLYAAALLSIVALADVGTLGPLVRGLHAVPMGDKVAHLVLATMLGYLAAAFPGAPRLSIGSMRIPIAVPFVVLVATLEEISQQFIPGRTYDLRDLAADFLGIAIGTALALRRARAAAGH